jgi:alpha-tubulin suppressor-like RCC1 family protein
VDLPNTQQLKSSISFHISITTKGDSHMKKKFSVSFSLALILMFVISSVASAAVWTDREDYAPGSVVTISGDNSDSVGFLPNETVHVEVIGPNDYLAACDGVVDEAGAWSCQITLWDTPLAIGDYTYTATGQESGVSQSGVFSDGASANHTCVVTMNGGVKCWGRNDQGQLGNGTTTDSLLPIDVIGLDNNIIQVSTSRFNTCVLTKDGGVKCWGNNVRGQLGNGTTINSSVPVDVIGLATNVVQISVSQQHACALIKSGVVKCWGANSFGQLGNGATTNSPLPVDVIGLSEIVSQISTGTDFSCALLANGGVKCWGTNRRGQLANGKPTIFINPVPGDVIGYTSGIAEIKSGIYRTCAITTSGGVKCWGAGYANGPIILTSGDVPGLATGISHISTGEFSHCAITTNGEAKCWGSNSNGQLGNGSTVDSALPVNVSGLTNGIVQVSSGANHSCALTANGGIKCWGNNAYGQLGNGTTTNSTTPVDVNGLTSDVWRLPEISGPAYYFSGFLAPIDNPDTVNVGKSGRTYPVKWQLTDSDGVYISNLDVITSITYEAVSCGDFSSAVVDAIETNGTGNTSLRFDSDSNQYIYNWATPDTGCYILYLHLNSGQIYPAYFDLK